MDTTNTVETQITLPTSLYKLIEQKAQFNGNSINGEITKLLSFSLCQDTEELEQEFIEWEAASDEDWQKMETILATKTN